MMKSCDFDCCRPGGLDTTEYWLSLCSLPENARTLDIGCGDGQTVAYLSELGYNSFGIDCDQSIVSRAFEWCSNRISLADAVSLPFSDSMFDLVTFECSFSKIKSPDAALSEAHRVLKSGGYLALSDFYSNGKETEFHGILGRVERIERILKRIECAGFTVQHVHDFSDDSAQMCGNMIFKYGAQEFYRMIGGTKEELKAAKCGYAVITAVK